MWATQAAVEMWASVQATSGTQMTVTQMALETWAPVTSAVPAQARAMIPGWYGFGAAAAKMHEMGRGEELAQLYAQSRFFRTVISNLEMVLAKTDLDIARHYADLVEDQNLANGIFARIEAECKATHETVLSLTGQKALLEHNPALAESIRLRLPYIDALNLLQLDLLRRRRSGKDDPETLQAIHMSINGVSAGLRNSG